MPKYKVISPNDNKGVPPLLVNLYEVNCGEFVQIRINNVLVATLDGKGRLCINAMPDEAWKYMPGVSTKDRRIIVLSHDNGVEKRIWNP